MRPESDRQPRFPSGAVLAPDFFARASPDVGHDLIGKILWSPDRGGGRLTEVEAYLPATDPASHSFRGPTQRNAAMFGAPGTIYVFLSYGVHYLLNFVCDRVGIGSAVLIRAFEALHDDGSDLLRTQRGRGACGPGLVGKALAVAPSLNGLSLGQASGLYVLDDGERPEVGVSTRIGISRGEKLPLRYYLVGSTCITRGSATRGGPCR